MANSLPESDNVIFFNAEDDFENSTTFLRLGDNEIQLWRKEDTNTNGLFLINNATEGDVTLLQHTQSHYLIFEDDRFAIKFNDSSLFDYNNSNGQLSILQSSSVEIVLNNNSIALKAPQVFINENPVIAPTSTGLSNTTSVTGVTAGSQITFGPINVANKLFHWQALRIQISNITGAGTISSFAVALYVTEEKRDNALGDPFNIANKGEAGGLVYLASNITSAVSGTAIFEVEALGYGYSEEVNPSLFGVIKNNDSTNTADFTFSVETYSVPGEKDF